MKHSNISIFVPHIGCPNMCSFCNQRTISGVSCGPSGEDVKRICTKAMADIKDRENTEIAFFGGSFTAIEREYMISLLEACREFVGKNGFKGIRISTRPDFIGKEILGILKSFGVTSIELGAQSMNDKVLTANNRGHSAKDVYKAATLIREEGFELGLQMMVGLYKSTVRDEKETLERIVEIHPDTVRIYPVVVLEGTELARLYKSGEYKLLPFYHVIQLCADMLEEFFDCGIDVIKCGLHASDGVEGEMVAGFYHPAFREICEGLIYRKKMDEIISDKGNTASFGEKKAAFEFDVNPSCVSKALGHKKSNAVYFKNLGIDIKVFGDESVEKYKCKLR